MTKKHTICRNYQKIFSKLKTSQLISPFFYSIKKFKLKLFFESPRDGTIPYRVFRLIGKFFGSFLLGEVRKFGSFLLNGNKKIRGNGIFFKVFYNKFPVIADFTPKFPIRRNTRVLYKTTVYSYQLQVRQIHLDLAASKNRQLKYFPYFRLRHRIRHNRQDFRHLDHYLRQVAPVYAQFDFLP